MAPVQSVDYFSEVVSLFLSILGFGLVGLVFYLGCLLSRVVERFISGFTGKFHLKLNNTSVYIVMKLLVAAVALIVAAPSMPPFGDVVNTMLPIGDFQDVSGAFADREGHFLINIIFNVILEQIALSFAYFIPFILVDIVTSFVGSLLCDPGSKGGLLRSVILYAVDLFALFAINACVLNFGNFFGMMTLEFLRSINLSSGLVLFLVLLVVFVLMFFLAVRNLLSSDMLVAFLSVNIAASVMQFSITDSNRIWILLFAVACGLGSQIVRRYVSKEDDAIADALYALKAAGVIGLVSAGVFWLLR